MRFILFYFIFAPEPIKSPLEIYVDNENIILKRYSPYNACQITGEVSERNITLADGKITLSPTGA
ncbi:transition state regulator [Bacillus hominis]|nr:transition state regulator [Bacillus hominis]MDM5191272.1 transition state regulator [Bacillus hominis]MDM5436388.1 transition state regulator [Bacillus hominis]MDM5441671.1 transition state regulator [Bacillus hominis]